MNLDHINSALATMKINAACVNYSSHRHFAYYDLKLDPTCSISKIERRLRELSLVLQSKTIPILKVIPEKGIVRLQVALRSAETLPLTPMLSATQIADTWRWASLFDKDQNNNLVPRKFTSGVIPLTIGETDEGQNLTIDLASHPHTLIAGTTGSGKSTLIHTIIQNINHLNDNDIRMIKVLISDPKGVDFQQYKERYRVVTTYTDTIKMLKDVNSEMDTRYKFMAEIKVNELPHYYKRIVVIIDEVADLILQDKSKEFETLLIKIAQKSRAAGIHLIAATQRPSVDILTGVIKANFPARIACKVSSKVDSQVILDYPGAENLLGKGDAILRSPVLDQVRFQVATS